jgi:hypothetical protein
VLYYNQKEGETNSQEKRRLNTMSIKERIAELERNIFMLDMKDHWSAEDYATSREWHRELRELKAKED